MTDAGIVFSYIYKLSLKFTAQRLGSTPAADGAMRPGEYWMNRA